MDGWLGLPWRAVVGLAKRLVWLVASRDGRERLILALAAPLLAIIAAVAITSVVMSTTGQNPFNAYQVMLDFGIKSDSQVWIINKAIPYYLAAAAVAIGFRMNLFNIGVDGQYRVAAFFAAVVGGALSLPGPIQIPIIILVGMACGAIWSGIAGWLKASRGVSEVITTIMLNFIGGSLIGYFLQKGRLAELEGNILHTPDIPDSSFFFEIPTSPAPIHGTIVLAALAGIGYWLVLNRTRFGFDLRAVGRSEPAAEASGVSVRRTIVTAMLLSGAVAGLVGMPTLLNESGNFGADFPEGLGFTGIAIALLGRNHAVGMAFAALLWTFLERTGTELEFEGYAQEIVDVMQGVIVLCVVIAYELVRRWGLRRQQRRVGEELAAGAAGGFPGLGPGPGPDGPGGGSGGGPGGGPGKGPGGGLGGQGGGAVSAGGVSKSRSPNAGPLASAPGEASGSGGGGRRRGTARAPEAAKRPGGARPDDESAEVSA